MSTGSHRRTWNLAEYSLKAHENSKEQQLLKKNSKSGKIIKNSQSAKNNKNLDLKSKIKVGKVNIVNPSKLNNGFYCSTCDVLKFDSINYLSHLNSKAHLKNIGKGLTVERSSLAQVQERLNAKKNQEKKVEVKKTKPKAEVAKFDQESEKMKELMGFCSFGKN